MEMARLVRQARLRGRWPVSHPATVFVVGDVAHVVESIFDAPVPAHQSEDDLGGGLVGGQ